ncbi:V4R domain-containing protein [Methanopyrus sp.]
MIDDGFSPESLRERAEEAGSVFTAEELLATNKMVMMALYSLGGERSCASVFRAGRMLAGSFGAETLEDALHIFCELTGAYYDLDRDYVAIESCPECLGYVNAEGAVCNFLRGFISRAAEHELGEVVSVAQVACEATGDRRCEFILGERGEIGGFYTEVDQMTAEDIEIVMSADGRDAVEVAAFKIVSEGLLRCALGDVARPMFFRAGRLYARAFINALDPEDPDELIGYIEGISGSSYSLEGDRFIVEKCLECAGMPFKEPICHAVRGALAEILEHWEVPLKGLVEARCAAEEGEVVGTCVVKARGAIWKAKRVVDAVKRAFH